MTSKLDSYANTWEVNAQQDALYAVLSSADRRASWNEAEFFAAGVEEISRVLAFMKSAGISPRRFNSFLDFGCGVGRNTRALMHHFDHGIGVDISPSMIEQAVQYAKGDARSARYVVNTEADLRQIPSDTMDLVYSHIVLQHVPSLYQLGYISEFLRVLSPGGIAAFQVITGWHARSPIRAIKRLLAPGVRKLRRTFSNASIRMEMHVVSAKSVVNCCSKVPVRVLAAPFTNSSEPDHVGRVEFMDSGAALQHIRSGKVDSDYLSQFFFVQK